MAELSPTFNEVPPILGECSIDVIFRMAGNSHVVFLRVKYFIRTVNEIKIFFLSFYFFSFSFVT